MTFSFITVRVFSSDETTKSVIVLELHVNKFRLLLVIGLHNIFSQTWVFKLYKFS